MLEISVTISLHILICALVAADLQVSLLEKLVTQQDLDLTLHGERGTAVKGYLCQTDLSPLIHV